MNYHWIGVFCRYWHKNLGPFTWAMCPNLEWVFLKIKIYFSFLPYFLFQWGCCTLVQISMRFQYPYTLLPPSWDHSCAPPCVACFCMYNLAKFGMSLLQYMILSTALMYPELQVCAILPDHCVVFNQKVYHAFIDEYSS